MPALINVKGAIFQAGPRPAGMAAAPAATTGTGGKGKGGKGGKVTGGGKAAAPRATDWAGLLKTLTAPPDYSGLAGIASTRAGAETAATIAGYTALQKAAIQQASQRAAQQGQLGLATSKYLEGLNLGGAVAGDYANAAAAQRAAASGYSGGLQQTVSDAAAGVQANLDAMGSPQTAYNQGAGAGNALYGLGGNLPALQLDAIGPAVAAGLRELPAQALGYAQQLAGAQLGQGQTEAAKYNADIAEATAGRGALAGKYLDTLSEQARLQGNARVSTILKIMAMQQKEAAGSGSHQIDTSASKLLGYVVYKDGTVAKDAKGRTIPVSTGAGGMPDYRQFGDTLYRETPDGLVPVLSKPAEVAKPDIQSFGSGGVMRINPNGTIDILRHPDKTSGGGLETEIVGSDASGRWLVDSNTGAKIRQISKPVRSGSTASGRSPVSSSLSNLNHSYTNTDGQPTDEYGNLRKPGQNKVPIPGYMIKNGYIVERPDPKKPKKPKKSQLTASLKQQYIAEINETVRGLKAGGVVDGVEHPAVGYKQAVLYLMEQGYFAVPELAKIAKAALSRVYGPALGDFAPDAPKGDTGGGGDFNAAGYPK